MAARHKSVETKYYEERDRVLRALRKCDRRSFLKIAAASMGAVLAKGLIPPHTFQLVEIANAAVEKGWKLRENCVRVPQERTASGFRYRLAPPSAAAWRQGRTRP